MGNQSMVLYNYSKTYKYSKLLIEGIIRINYHYQKMTLIFFIVIHQFN